MSKSFKQKSGNQKNQSPNRKGQAQVQLNGNSLRIQLPRHLFNGKQKYISLGANTAENKAKAEALLLEIQRDINYEEFDISLKKYRTEEQDNSSSLDNSENSQSPSLNFQEMLDLFEKKYFLTTKETRQSLDTFKQHKQHLLRLFKFKNTYDFYLEPEEDIKTAIQSTEAGTAIRVKSVDTLKFFCKLLDIEYNFQGLANGYVPKERTLPTDSEIIEGFYKIQEKGKHIAPEFAENAESWGWIYAVVATYGIRPHEILAIDYSKSFKPPYYPLYIEEHLSDGTKTGSRIVFPVPLEWVELFDINNPKTIYIEKTKKYYEQNIRKFADRLGERAKSKGLKFKIYDLRHRYAVRIHEMGVFPIDDAARWMGHSVELHVKVYQKYLTEETNSLVYEEGLRNIEEMQRIKEGKPSYKELEETFQQAKQRIAILETEWQMMNLLLDAN